MESLGKLDVVVESLRLLLLQVHLGILESQQDLGHHLLVDGLLFGVVLIAVRVGPFTFLEFLDTPGSLAFFHDLAEYCH